MRKQLLLLFGLFFATGTLYAQLSVSGTVEATSFSGTLSTSALNSITSVGSLTGLTVSGQINAGTISATISTALQPSITLLGTLSTITVTGIIENDALTISGLINSNSVTVTGNITAGSISLTNGGLTASSLTVTGALTAGSISLTGGIVINAETVTGNITAGSVSLTGNGLSANAMTVTGNITARSISLTGTGLSANALTITGNITAGSISTTGIISAVSFSGIGIPAYVFVSTSSSTNATTTLTDITGLKIDLIGGNTYVFEAVLGVGASNAAGNSYAVNYTGTSVIEGMVTGILLATSQKTVRIIANNTAATPFATVVGANGSIYIAGTIVPSTSGTFSVRDARVGAAGLSQVAVNSFLKVVRVK